VLEARKTNVPKARNKGETVSYEGNLKGTYT
jgi:hypothetical protein